jgi:hypothetical protein
MAARNPTCCSNRAIEIARFFANRLVDPEMPSRSSASTDEAAQALASAFAVPVQ